MPVFSNYNQTESKFDVGFSQPEPGAYVLRVVAVRTEWTERDYQTGIDRNCTTASESAVMLVYDIADGEHAGEYSREFYQDLSGNYNKRKDFMHQYKFRWGDLNNEKDAQKAKYTLDCFTACNPGFDALAAFNADQWALFVGKLFGAVLNGTVKTNERGYDTWNLRPSAKIYTLEDIASGNHAEPRITDRRTGGASTASGGQYEQAPADVYDDLPFN